jgi:hypothetical protein
MCIYLTLKKDIPSYATFDINTSLNRLPSLFSGSFDNLRVLDLSSMFYLPE